MPIAIYSKDANKTFFCYGGSPADKNRLHHMVAFYDHATGKVSRPRMLLDKRTSDAHDNPTLQIDVDGHIWIFSNAHGTSRPAYVHRSVRPYSIDAFERIRKTNFSYGQPWFSAANGFTLLHTIYRHGERQLCVSRSPHGRVWGDPQCLALTGAGQYQISWADGDRIGTAFNYHPVGKGLNWRTNLYYLETTDGGDRWRNAAGSDVATPLLDSVNTALVFDAESEGKLVYIKDLQFTADGAPVILYLTSGGYKPGPQNGPRELMTAQWTGSEWAHNRVTTLDHNYDFASLYIEPDGVWRLIGTTAPGPQPFTTGGDIGLWISRDAGSSWEKTRDVTTAPDWNHTFPRRPMHASPDFYAIWADGDAKGKSSSRLYFANQDGDVWMLPEVFPEGVNAMAPVRVVDGK